MKRGVIILLVCSVVLGLCSCSLVTPSVKKCKENAKSLVTQDHRWHANITIKGGTQGGSDFAATGESDIDVVNGVARTHGYMRVSGSYMAMEEQFDVIQANGSSERYTLANRKGLWILDRLSRTFASDFQKLIDANKNTGRFTNRTVTFNEKSCYFLSYEVTSAEIIQDFFPCNTKKVIGKDYIDNIEKLSVIRTANARGDTESVRRIKAEIVVHRPDLVTLNPQREHGEGSERLNEMESLVRCAGDPLTAALLLMATT